MLYNRKQFDSQLKNTLNFQTLKEQDNAELFKVTGRYELQNLNVSFGGNVHSHE